MIAHAASPLANCRKVVFANTLRGCQIFTGLPSDDLDLISSFVIPKELSKGEYLFREGAASEGFYVVQRGAVNVSVSAPGSATVTPGRRIPAATWLRGRSQPSEAPLGVSPGCRARAAD